MKIALVLNQAPFLTGGAELLADSLKDQLEQRRYEADIVRIPFSWQPPEAILDHMLAARLLRIDNADRIIAMKFPAYFVPHDNKVLWLLHQFRQAYDLWGTEYQGLPGSPEGIAIRDAIRAADTKHLPEAKRIYTNSRVVSRRLKRFNGLDSEVLHPPLMNEVDFHFQGLGDFVFCPGRISAGKRQHLLVESMRYVKSDARLVVAGPPELPRDAEVIWSLIDRYGLHEKVDFEPGWLPQERKVQLYATALACAYVPFDEDSYGYVTLESCYSQKSVITCTDSGGILDLVDDATTGYVTAPEPRQLAEAIDRLMLDRDNARQLGLAAFEHAQALDISWENVIERLVA